MRYQFLASLSSTLFVATQLSAQSAAGVAGISDVVRDPSGSTVLNAKVVIASEGQGTLRTLTRNPDGVFATRPGARAGLFDDVKASGFAPYQVKDAVLQVGQNLDLQVNLTVAGSATALDVVATAPLVQGTKTDLSRWSIRADPGSAD